MKTKFIFTLFCSALLFSCGKTEDDGMTGEVTNPDQGMASFEVVLCTDTANDPTCTDSFDPVVGAKIQLYNNLEDLELESFLVAEKLTLGDGKTSFSGLAAGDFHYKVLSNVDTLVHVFGVNNNAAAMIRVEFEAE